MKKKSNKLTTILLVVIMLGGLSLLLYPTVSDYWNSFHQSRAIAEYADTVTNMNEDLYREMWKSAEKYNASIIDRKNVFMLNEKEREKYNKTLNVTESGVMGYIEIPSIQCSLPIYHGTSEPVLQVAVGHIEWTGLPVGGEGSHCVLSGHRGLPSAKLFTNLDKMNIGDIFMLRVLDEVLTYEVDQILIVLPNETQELQPVRGEDYCTLVTCTPYGINSHRLLVRGHRIENLAEAKTIHVTADAVQVRPLIVAPILAIPMLLILLIIVLVPGKKRKEESQ